MSSSPLELRAPREDEAQAAAELIDPYERRLFGVEAVSAAEVRHWWEVDVDRATRVRIAPGGYADPRNRRAAPLRAGGQAPPRVDDIHELAS